MQSSSFLIAGHAEFGRLETLRDYLIKKKIRYILVVYFNLAFSKLKKGRIEIYINGRIKNKINLFHYTFRNNSKYKYILILFTYFTYLLSIVKIYNIVKKKKINIYVGIGTYISFLLYVIFLSDKNKNKLFIYYCIDFFNRFFYKKDFLKIKYFINYIELKIQLYLLKKSDYVWEISKKISNVRSKAINFINAYKINSHLKRKKFILPLGYSKKFINDINKNIIKIKKKNIVNIVFIGVVNPNQSLDELIIAVKHNKDFFNNKIHIYIVGEGEYLNEVKSKIILNKLQNFFTICGFLNNKKLIKIMSIADYGYAVFSNFKGNHSLNAEPGKIKLYSIYKIPCIVTKNIYLSKLLKKYECGLIIKDNKHKTIANIIKKIIRNNYIYKKKFRRNIKEFIKKECIADFHFENFFKLTKIIK